MPLDTVEREDRAIVITGFFSPEVLRPGWLRRKGILSPSELDPDEPIDQLIVTPQVVAIPGSWFSIRATPDRLMFVSGEAEMFGSLRDLAMDVLDQFPNPMLSAIGLNTIMHFRVPQGRSWEQIRTALAPPQVWGDVLSDPTISTLTLKSSRSDGAIGARYVRIEPSVRIQDGIFIELNDHHQLGAQTELVPISTPVSGVVDDALEVLRSEWDNSYQLCRDVAEKITLI